MSYDQTNPESIEEYGKRLVGGTLSSVKGIHEVPQSEKDKSISGRTRGSLGTIVEEYYYDIKPENDGTPDFPDAGVELKTTPIKKNINGTYSAKERLVLGMIDYLAEAGRDFSSSSYHKKNQKLMVLSYLHEENKTIGDVSFLLAKLYKFENLPKADQKIIIEDWNTINTKIKANLAHELSEGDTLYLGACTKSATSRNRRKQLNGPDAKPRAFSYKQSYMTQLMKREFNTAEDVEKLLTDKDLLEDKTFEQQVIGRFSTFIGRSASDIAKEFEINFNPSNKGAFAKLARAMMGVRKKKIDEFEAAGITMKTIQLNRKGSPHQHMSFPAFKYEDIISEKWDGDEEEGESRTTFQKQLESRFLLVVYRCEDKCIKDEDRVLEKVFFWTMPPKDLVEAEKVWTETVDLINEGRIVKAVKQLKDGSEKRYTYFPKSTQNSVSHVRPHGKDSSDTYPLPVKDKFTGKKVYTKHCFWLNKKYIEGVVK